MSRISQNIFLGGEQINKIDVIKSASARFTLPLLGLFISGMAGVGIDLDHMLVLFWRGETFTLENLATKAGRPLHWPGVIVGGIVFVIVVSRHFRLLAKLERHECD